MGGNKYYGSDNLRKKYGKGKLQNLSETQGTNINEFEAKAGSETMFDYNNGDPLANTDVTDMHMQKGAAIDFDGASGSRSRSSGKILRWS